MRYFISCCLAVLAIPSAARADDPAPSPAFVTIDRADATSRAGIEASYVVPKSQPGISDTSLRFEGHGQYVDPDLRVGGYIQMPITYLSESENGASNSATGVGDIEVGGIYVPRLPIQNLGLALRVGITAPTGSEGDNSVANGIGIFSRATDLIDVATHGTTLRLAASPLWQSGIVFARADLGFDIMLGGSGPNRLTLLRLNAAVGAQLGPLASLSLESVNLYDVSDDTAGGFGSSWFNTGAIAARFHAGLVEPYAAVVIALDHDSTSILNAAITVGADVHLR
jgi:hypothetical protein